MTGPDAGRPWMPGYGTLPADQGTGLLPWSWAEERLARSHDYWLATRRPDGRPHLTPVWGVWRDGAVEVSCSTRSRKAANLAADPRCSVATDDAQEPVLVEGVAEVVRDRDGILAFLEAVNAKYGTAYDEAFLDPGVNATVRIRPTVAFGLVEEDFAGSPTRWRFA